MFLILGNADPHTERIRKKIEARGHSVGFLDTRTFPSRMTINFQGQSPSSGFIRLTDNETPVPLSDIQGVYWYCYNGVALAPGMDPQSRAYASTEIESFLQSFFLSLDCRWVNPPWAVQLHKTKLHQLQTISSLGCRVPDTLVTNDSEQVQAFYERHGGQVIAKPLASLGIPERLKPEHLSPERMAVLKQIPVQLQEYIEGIDYRVHVVGEQLFPTAIHTETDLYKTDPQMILKPVSIPKAIEQQCIRIAQALDLVLAGIDCRLTPEGEAVFFEANPSPQFMIFEEQCDYPISDTLVDVLIGQN